ncbi:TlpA disulfide reductase family protein [Chitinophaga sp. Cy-1792]|uniref:TlpA disulfide reductase family protein n=1 Tax=Chitinophaga sp. Cy-1792 TaxID=2608339 RepID=UPI0014226089|nr:TlpA disulfide reductase family protein [Chitinophaga sp. Cy-1792]NIG57637.1 TlpA family protein disulfide reductase [Chitinophaga sp. Cy-1792]
MKKLWSCLLAGLSLAACQAGGKKDLQAGTYQAKLHRKDGADIVFNFEVKDTAGRKVLYVLNATDRLLVDEVKVNNDSVFIKMPFFDSDFKAAIAKDGSLNGSWTRHLADKDVSIPFTAIPNTTERFPQYAPAKGNVNGRWSTWFIGKEKNDSSYAIGEFKQNGNTVHGTFLTSTGDYRFLDGIVSGDTLKLSTFDGSHAYLFTALINADGTLQGIFYAGIGDGKENWFARKDEAAKLPDETSLVTAKPGAGPLEFSFPDLNGNKVSLRDDRFKGKVVVVTLMGSWCPNCMDETNYLAEWYKKNHDRGVEIIGLAYERTTDFEKSKNSLNSFLHRFDVQYPVLITGVTPGDPEKAAKTLPQLTGIKGFPTTIFIDKKGNVSEVHTGFNGPGTGEHYEEFKYNFNRLIDKLLAE